MKKASGVIKNISGKGLKIGIVVSRFNQDITSKLLEGAEKILKQKNAKCADVYWVPGAFEVPLMLQALTQKNKKTKSYDALIALACVIRGDTPHFDYVCQEISRGVMDVSLKRHLPIIFGVLTTDNMQQCIERIGGKHGHKGEEAALTAIEMAQLLRGL